MTQVVNVEPEFLSKNRSVDMRGRRYPAIGTPEHAALVNLIRLNFPEIYEDPEDSQNGQQVCEPGVWRSAIQPPACV
jgi:hypothetical protein